jgi:hypothetical protein
LEIKQLLILYVFKKKSQHQTTNFWFLGFSKAGSKNPPVGFWKYLAKELAVLEKGYLTGS